MKEIILFDYTGPFASNKDAAREIRETIIFPTLEKNDELIINFDKITGATQSFVHALISESMRIYGVQNALEKIKFKSCNEKVKAIITIVAEYMQASLS